ncbi:LytR/AlgR family response regulator transcription factor [Parapedobacter koreensis]|uniref:Transcriptional regulator, LytTR family n=1 Tax=Parapedobacter koreensis TaxID=332977 RepID=A0A1H7GV75_9SPHI|nr:LytTR family DNA-binding domain-containing protein [Parapedobacter koreensis]SEK41944.1 transcriptional regulator, LytTR family [Parapedobacter koreensis]
MIFDLSYPKSESKKEIFISSIFTGISVYLFLLVFQPFGTNTIPNLKLFKILFPYFFIVFTVFYLVNLFSLNILKEWNLGKETLKVTCIIFLCSVLGYLYNTLLISKVDLSFLNFVYMFLYTLSIAIPICSVYMLTRFIYLSNQNKKIASELSEKITSKKVTDELTSENKIIINEFVVNENDLYFIESTDNYCTFYYEDNSEIKKILIRTTLKSTLEQIKSENILRCHRSFIVNLKKVKNIKGNAQGYKLKLKNIDVEVSVSRKYMEEVKNIVNN